MTEAEAVVQRQVEAYNDQDVEAFLATYHPDTRIVTLPDKVQMVGHDEMCEKYGELFATYPGRKAEITSREVLNNFVIDREKVTNPDGSKPGEAIAIYEVRDGLIVNVWFAV